MRWRHQELYQKLTLAGLFDAAFPPVPMCSVRSSVNLGPIVYQNDQKLTYDMAQRFTDTGIKPQVRALPMDAGWCG